MINLSCFLINKETDENSIGVQDLKNEANEQGLRPDLRIVISSLSYNDEKEIEYDNERYSIIRTQIKNLDEVILICERKLKDV